jgi:hypothetical protein
MIRKSMSSALVVAAIAVLSTLPMMALADSTEPLATYGEKQIPMTTAIALELSCNAGDDGVACFDTEEEALDVAAAAAAARSGAVAAASCTPAMQLYDGTSFTGASLNITTQSTWFNLSTLGFDNITSSWKSGCVAGRLASGTGGAGTLSTLGASSSNSNLGAFSNTASSAKRCPC